MVNICFMQVFLDLTKDFILGLLGCFLLASSVYLVNWSNDLIF